ncbi:hypothetical protein BCR35DRAFT_306156 [Leucosporidium creatinivorum]|uniref:Uncharacterized protein n=1 Tax=Leucosporidium creatinivorum TaxID=106004 RepID=A0A1Y2EVM4_9BASI|nr:hypothetical protein BCR35DRAFT_306156 [Leucosporidium creatinivorum]
MSSQQPFRCISPFPPTSSFSLPRRRLSASLLAALPYNSCASRPALQLPAMSYSTMSEKPAALNLDQQHRRRISLPSTPPETPMREYFSGHGTRELHHSLSGMPPSPPATPTRVLSNTAQQDDVLPSYTAFQGRRPSEAYAHHRRTSTTTIIRLAVASARSGTVFPTKIITGIFLLLSFGYLATFLPFHSFVHHPQPSPMVSTPNPFIPSYSQHPVQQQKVEADSTIDDAVAQRKAWSQSFDHRAPPHLAAPVPVVPANRAGSQELFSVDGELMRAHPELLSHQPHGRGPQRRRKMPVRLAGGKGAKVDAPAEPKKEDTRAMVEEDDAPSVKDTIDVSSATDSEKKAAAALGAGKKQPKAAPKNKAMERMAKMAKAKAGSARVGGTVPLDSSAQRVDSHVFVKGGSGKKKSFKGAKQLTAEDADVPKPKEIAAAVGKGHPRNAVKGVVAAAAEQEVEGIDEDWTSAMEAEDEGDE